MPRNKFARLEVVHSEERHGMLSLRGQLGTSIRQAVTAGGFNAGDDTVLLPAKAVDDVNAAIRRLEQWRGTSHDEDELMLLLTHLTAVSEPLR
jgi:hypothetical protein